MSEHRSAQLSYDRLSRWYDLFSGSEVAVSRQALDLFQPAAGEFILEIGFGTGQILSELTLRVGLIGKVAGLDRSPGMARVAQARLEQANRARALLTVGDAIRLPYPDGCLDGIFCAFTLELFDEAEIPVVLVECRRVLRPGGRIGVVSLFKPPARSRAVAIYEWFHRRMPNLVDCRPIPTQQIIAAAGFTLCVIESQALWGLPVQMIVAARP